jgi:hypothetical protein
MEDFSLRVMEESSSKMFKVLKRKNNQERILHVAKLSFKNE